ncbi:MAG: hypothetical protein AB7G75_10365 [Candidatus Binatia bacterium]
MTTLKVSVSAVTQLPPTVSFVTPEKSGGQSRTLSQGREAGPAISPGTGTSQRAATN